MRNLFILILLCISLSLSATTYYISSAGNDAANGLSETTSWKTITKVNSAFSTFKPGDMILFNRGDVFYGTINVTVAGASGNPITISAYGTGNTPVISGFTTLTGWTSAGNGIYSKVVSTGSMPNMVIVDGVNTPLGRTPNLPSIHGWPSSIPTGDSFSSTSMTDADLAASPALAGAEVVIRTTQWTTERKTVTHSNHTLSYSATSYTPPTGAGYFIQNHISTLDVRGEWCYSNGTIYMYFGPSDNPDNHTVKVSSIDNLINNTKSYITFSNLTIEGANKFGINLNNADYNTVQNCTIRFGGNYGIYGTGCDYDLITLCTIDNNNDYGVYLTSECTHTTIKSNTISNSGMILGMGSSGDNGYNAVVCEGGYSLITYNTINNSGYDGIRWGGQASEVSYNFINNSCQNKTDGGAIYSYRDYNTAKVLKYNIILNSTAQPYGWPAQDFSSANGIYMDGACNTTISNNVIAQVQGKGIFVNSDQNNIVESNTFYDNTQDILVFSENKGGGVNGKASGHTIRYNTLVAKTASQYCLYISSDINEADLHSFGTIDYNYYARPMSTDNYIFWYWYIAPSGYGDAGDGNNIAQFASTFGYDAHSTMSSIAVTDVNKIRFEYNETNANKVVSLDAGYVDAVGTKYSGSITLLPFTALVLMVDPNPAAAPAAPVYTNSLIASATPSLLEMTYSLSLGSVIPNASAFSVMVNSIARAVTTVAVSGTKVQLTLASPVVSGDVVTVSYTKPTTNPIQTAAGGQAVSIGAQAVTNNVSVTNPLYVSSAVANTTPSLLEMTYNLTLNNIVPSASAFTVLVNSVARTVNTVAISGTKVQLTLASPIVSGDVVTVSYTKPAANPIQTAGGGQAITITAQTVTNNVSGVNPVYTGSSVESATPSVIGMTYNTTLANIVPAASSFVVLVNSVARVVNSVTVSGTSVKLTLSTPIVSGDVVSVAYTKPTVNPLQTATGGQAVTITAQTVTNNVSGVNPVYTGSSVESATPSVLSMTYNNALANIVPTTSSFVVLVNSVARVVNSVVVSGTSVKLTLSTPIVSGDIVTVSYTKPTVNPLQTSAGAQAVTIAAQSVTNNVAGINPTYINSAVANATPSLLEMSYNQALSSVIPASTSFSVLVNSVARVVNAVVVSGTKVQLTLSSPIKYGDKVTVSYTKPVTNPLQSAAGGTAISFSNQVVTNNCVNLAPVATITSPIINSTFTASSNITITASASDADGSVSMVDFYNGSTKLGSVSSSPYAFTWNNVVSGNYSLSVVATDNMNAKTTSSAVPITVSSTSGKRNKHPYVKISSPTKGNTYANLTSITINALASDSDGVVSKVEFFNGSARLVELTTAPYSYTWKDVPAGTYSITAVATDNLNDTTKSSPIEFIVGTTVKYDPKSEVVKLYPNPNNGHFTLEFINPMQNEKGDIVITDLGGKQVYHGPITKEELTKQIDLPDSRSGVYVLMIRDKDILVTKKFIKN